VFDIADPGWAAMLACDDAERALFGEPEPEPPPLDFDQTHPAPSPRSAPDRSGRGTPN